MIKASGNFTHYLYESIEPGRKATVEGSYGMLDYRRGGPELTWIAGGIGIPPFLSWLRDLDDLNCQIDFSYTVRNPDEALFTDEIEEATARHPGLVLHLNISPRDGSLTMERIDSLSRLALGEDDLHVRPGGDDRIVQAGFPHPWSPCQRNPQRGVQFSLNKDFVVLAPALPRRASEGAGGRSRPAEDRSADARLVPNRVTQQLPSS